MNCNFCGGQLADGAKFCTHCGRSLEQVEQPQAQPQQPVMPTQPAEQAQPQQPVMPTQPAPAEQAQPQQPVMPTQPTEQVQQPQPVPTAYGAPPQPPTGYQAGQGQVPPAYQPGQNQVPPTQYNNQQQGPQPYPSFAQPPMQQAQANNSTALVFTIVGWVCFVLSWLIAGIPLSIVGCIMGACLYQYKQGMAIGLLVANGIVLLLMILSLASVL